MTRIEAGQPYDHQQPERVSPVPACLTSLDQWVAWRYEKRKDKPTKVPYTPGTQRRASSTDRSTWQTHAQAVADRTSSGPGFVFSDDDPYSGIDLDDCLDGDTLAPWAAEILASLPPTYTEISPSETGLKIWVVGELPRGCRHRRKIEGGEIEVYSTGRFFTVTGRKFRDSPSTVAKTDLNQWYCKWFPAATARPDAPPVNIDGGFPGDDDELISAIRHSSRGDRFASLFDDGDLSDYGNDHSSADQSLCNTLAWWCGPNPERIDRLFKRSALYRAKWDRIDYRDRTVDSAIRGQNSFYQPRNADVPRPSRDSEPMRRAKAGRPYTMTDVGNAERMVSHYADAIRYVAKTGQWYLWDGRRWACDDRLSIQNYAIETVRAIRNESMECEDAEIREQLMKHAVKSEAKARIDSMIRLAAARPGLAAGINDLDTDPWLFNASNGTIDLRTGVLRDHDPADMITHVAPTGYHPGAKCDMWRKFLFEIFHGNQELIDYVQEVLGLCISGDITEQFLPVFYGDGANGKSTLLDTMLNILGPYADKAAPDLIMARKNEQHPTEVADLWGKRMVITSETEEGRKLRTSFVKEITGDTTCKARFMRGDFFKFDRTHKIILMTNHKPRVSEGKQAIWRRLKLVPFTLDIAKEDQDKQLLHKLDRERVGILAWLVAGCRRWHERGCLEEPIEVSAATDDYRDAENPLSEFIEAKLAIDPDAFLPSSELRRLYNAWCDLSNVNQKMGDRALANRIAEVKGVKPDKQRVNGVSCRGFSGIRGAQ